MKNELDEVRTLAIKLFNASQTEKQKQPKYIWGTSLKWRDLPSESIALWDAIAVCALKETK